jgi:hypothetical protein
MNTYLYAQKRTPKNFLKKILKAHPEKFGNIRKNIKKNKVQIIYTQINRDNKNNPILKSFTYNTQKKEYFYPASSVKLPLCLLALEKINNLNIKGLDKNTPFFSYARRPPQTERLIDTTSPTGLPTIAHDIKKILLVSDNESSNRLFEFLGQAYINEKLKEKGFKNSLILHRLAAPTFNEENNRYSNPFQFKKIDTDTIIYEEKEKFNPLTFKQIAKNTKIGKGYINKQGKLIHEPLNFERRNFMALQDIHQCLKAVIFPETLPKKARFNLTKEDYDFLRTYMGMLPKESKFPQYDLNDSYAKYFLGSVTKNKKIPEDMRIFNKVGMAFGYLIDNAYVVDYKNKIEFMLSAVIYVNENEILNDDNKYEYESVGFPFFENLFETIYDYEKKRIKKFEPNLKDFELKFND